MAPVVIGLLLGHSQSVIIPGCSFGEVSKLSIAGTKRQTEMDGERERGRDEEVYCSTADESAAEGE